jgi:hypothetical protein
MSQQNPPQPMSPELRQLAIRSLDSGHRCAYEQDDDGNAPAPMDWAHFAARGVLSNLGGRRGMDCAINDLDQEIRQEIVDTVAAIIRMAPLHFRTIS